MSSFALQELVKNIPGRASGIMEANHPNFLVKDFLPLCFESPLLLQFIFIFGISPYRRRDNDILGSVFPT